MSRAIDGPIWTERKWYSFRRLKSSFGFHIHLGTFQFFVGRRKAFTEKPNKKKFFIRRRG